MIAYVPRGVRDCIVARPGCGFASVDFKGGELVTFSQSAIYRVGWSNLADALNAGLDAHAALGATMLGWSYERMAAALGDKAHPDHKIAKAFRQCAKWGNFGFLGGMREVKFALTQRRQGEDTPHPTGPSIIWDGKAFVPGYKGLRLCILVRGAERCSAVKITEWNRRPCPPVCKVCVEVAADIRRAFMQQWTEAQPYLDWHARNADQVGWVEQHYTRRIRGGVDYNSEANGDFQALLADIAKNACCRITREMYVDLGTSLYGARMPSFQHDETFIEAALPVLPEVAERATVVMVEEFRLGCPDVAAACAAEPAIAERWWKSMEMVRDAAGRLVLWTPPPWRA